MEYNNNKGLRHQTMIGIQRDEQEQYLTIQKHYNNTIEYSNSTTKYSRVKVVSGKTLWPKICTILNTIPYM